MEARLEALEDAVRRSQEAPEKQSEAKEPDKRNFDRAVRCEEWSSRDARDVQTPCPAKTEAKKKETKNPTKRDLGKVTPRKRWGDEESLTPSSAETEAEEKRTDNMSDDEDPDEIFFRPDDRGKLAE